MMRFLALTVVAVALQAVAAPAAWATVLVTENFNTYSNGNLSGQVGAGLGETGSWTTIPNVNLSSNNIAGGATSDNRVSTANGAGSQITLASPLTDPVLYFSYTVTNNETAGGTLGATRLDLNPFPFGTRISIGAFGGPGATTFAIFEESTGKTVNSGVVSLPGTYQIYGVIDEYNDRLAIWVNPTTAPSYDAFTLQNDALAVLEGWTGDYTISALGFVTNAGDNASFDNLEVGSLPSPSPVPEPATLGLAGLGALSVLRRRGRATTRSAC